MYIYSHSKLLCVSCVFGCKIPVFEAFIISHLFLTQSDVVMSFKLFAKLMFVKRLMFYFDQHPLFSKSCSWEENFFVVMETGIVTRSKGSSYIEIGNTKVICAW